MLNRPELDALVRHALDEDVGAGDVTTLATVSEQARARALITQKAPGVIYGLQVAEATFEALDARVRAERLVEEGVWRDGGPVLALEGSARALLTGERTALNFLARLSGVATLAARAVRTVEGTGARVLDTRKTTPGLRALEKAAVAAGGATNHRAPGSTTRSSSRRTTSRWPAGSPRPCVAPVTPRPSWRRAWRSRCAAATRSSRRLPPALSGCCWTT